MTDYEISYEYDGEDFSGDILAFNLYGHGISMDDIDIFLHSMWEEDLIDQGEWEVREDYLRKVPTRDGSLHVYGSKGRGAKAVTVVERPQGWNFWCFNHPYEPASTGVPAAQVTDGEALVERRLKELAEDVDPRYDVDNRSGMGPYIYLCRECGTSFHERMVEARKEALKKYNKEMTV